MVRYVGPSSPTGALAGDEWLDTSTADTTAPSAVTGLTAGTATTTTVPLSWTAATDAVGVAGYEYSTNGAAYTSTGSTGTCYTVTGLTANTLYVRAYDAAGNRGASASVAKTTGAEANYISTVSALSPTYCLPLDDVAAPPRQIGSASGTITVTGSPTFGGPSLGGGATSTNFGVSAAAYVTPPNTTLDGSAAGTILGVIKLDAMPASTLGIMGKNLARRLTANNSGRMSVAGFGGTGISNNTTHTLAAATAYHVAVTYDGTTLKLFRKGVLAQSAASTGAIASSTAHPGAIGAVSSSSGLGGNMFGAAIFVGTALTDAQVLACAQAAGF